MRAAEKQRGHFVKRYRRNPEIESEMLPVDIVLAPSWWHEHEGMSFDEGFFYDPVRRVEGERKMERALYERWGRFGLGADRDEDRPEVGPVHLAAGFLISEMLGCEVKYNEGTPPEVVPARREDLSLDVDAAFESEAFRRFERLTNQLKRGHGYLVGDTNWGGVLNLAMDLRGETILLDMHDTPDEAQEYLNKIAQVIERFVGGVEKETGTSSISVNRTVRHIKPPLFVHSECSHTMISCQDYEKFLMDIDARWSREHRPFGVHYCGTDPHRYAESFAKLPHLDFLDVGWGGNVRELRKRLPNTFLNVRLSPVEMVHHSASEVRQTVVRLVKESDNPYLTGVCCVNMDANVPDENITAIFETVEELRKEYRAAES